MQSLCKDSGEIVYIFMSMIQVYSKVCQKQCDKLKEKRLNVTKGLKGQFAKRCGKKNQTITQIE